MPDAFQATYSDWKLIRGRKVVQIVLELPIEYSNDAYTVLGGMPNPAEEVWVGVALLDIKVRRVDGAFGNSRKSQPTTAEPVSADHEEPAPAVSARALSQLVGRFCADIRFRRWALDKGKVTDSSEIAVAEWVRQFCNVSSRADILPGTKAEQSWNLIQSAYEVENRV